METSIPSLEISRSTFFRHMTLCWKTPLTSKAYEGGLPDKTSVQELLETYTFPSNTVFLVDAGFYSEDDLGLYWADGKHFEVPVPDLTVQISVKQSDQTFHSRIASHIRKRMRTGLRRIQALYTGNQQLQSLKICISRYSMMKRRRKTRTNCADARTEKSPENTMPRKSNGPHMVMTVSSCTGMKTCTIK